MAQNRKPYIKNAKPQPYLLCSDSGVMYSLYHCAITKQTAPPHCHYDERECGIIYLRKNQMTNDKKK